MKKTKEVAELIGKIRTVKRGDGSIDLMELRECLGTLLCRMRNDIGELAGLVSDCSRQGSLKPDDNEYKAWLDGFGTGAGLMSTICDLSSAQEVRSPFRYVDAACLERMFKDCGWRKTEKGWRRSARKKRRAWE